MFNELLVTALLVPFITFSIWFMRITVMKFISTMDRMLNTNEELANIIKKELAELKEEVKKTRR
jgi:hypothetical protein